MKIVWNGREAVVQALVDTGNSLYEPISHKPVSIIEKQAMEAVLPGDVLPVSGRFLFTVWEKPMGS